MTAANNDHWRHWIHWYHWHHLQPIDAFVTKTPAWGTMLPWAEKCGLRQHLAALQKDQVGKPSTLCHHRLQTIHWILPVIMGQIVFYRCHYLMIGLQQGSEGWYPVVVGLKWYNCKTMKVEVPTVVAYQDYRQFDADRVPSPISCSGGHYGWGIDMYLHEWSIQYVVVIDTWFVVLKWEGASI